VALATQESILLRIICHRVCRCGVYTVWGPQSSPLSSRAGNGVKVHPLCFPAHGKPASEPELRLIAPQGRPPHRGPSTLIPTGVSERQSEKSPRGLPNPNPRVVRGSEAVRTEVNIL
jgi:hypothetical protein